MLPQPIANILLRVCLRVRQLHVFSSGIPNIIWKKNPDKYHLLMSKDKSSENHGREFIIKSSDCEKLVGIKIDPKVCF